MLNWSSLSEDILLLILKEITNLSDYIRFSTVCASWRSAAKHDLLRHRHQFPGLIIPINSTTTTTQTSLFLPITTINDRHRHRHRHRHRLPQLWVPQNTRCCGSHQGWLITMDTHHMAMHLLHPVTGVQYPLPPVKTLSSHPNTCKASDWAITKAVLSSTPQNTNTAPLSSQSNCTVLLIYGDGALALCRLGDTAWTSINSTTVPLPPFGHLDAIFYHGQFYVVHSSGNLFAFEFNFIFNPNLIRLMMTKLPNLPRLEKRYLVESGGELLQILRLVDHGGFGYKTTGFEVYRLDFAGNKWVGMRGLGKYALFLGLNQSMSVSESDLPGIKGNCIYFTDDLCSTNRYIESSGHDMGVFNLEDSTIEPLYPTSLASTELPAVWITPIPW